LAVALRFEPPLDFRFLARAIIVSMVTEPMDQRVRVS
jgi:hypothetical protein